MLIPKGICSIIYNKIKGRKIHVLWKSQQKRFAQIGKNCNVSDIPFVNGYEYISIGDNFFCGKDVRIEAWSKYHEQTFCPKIIIGNNVTFTDRCYLSCISKIEIGNGVLLGRDVFITDNSHGDSSKEMLGIQPSKRPLTSKGSVFIDDNVWIGRHVTILSGVSIGKNAIIGANSIVNQNIPDNCVAVGAPAKVIKEIR